MLGALVDAENREAPAGVPLERRSVSSRLVSAEILARESPPRGFASSRMTLAETRGVISSDYPLITGPKASQWNATHRPTPLADLRLRTDEVPRRIPKKLGAPHKLPISGTPQPSSAAHSPSFGVVCDAEDRLRLSIACQKKISN